MPDESDPYTGQNLYILFLNDGQKTAGRMQPEIQFFLNTLLTNDATEIVRHFTISSQDYLKRKNGNIICKNVADTWGIEFWKYHWTDAIGQLDSQEKALTNNTTEKILKFSKTNWIETWTETTNIPDT